METSTTYDAGLFALLERLEPTSFWFRSRNRLIAWAMGEYFAGATTLLEVGCGTGYVLAHLHRCFPSLSLTGGELFEAGLEVARRRVPDAQLLQLDITALPFDGEYDVVGAFDVLEHIPDDGAALAELRRAAGPGGGLLVTVPQHPLLWSAADEFAQHQRRYTRRGLVAAVEKQGWKPVRVTSFTFVALPLMAASRLRYRGRPAASYRLEKELSLPRIADRALDVAARMEQGIISAGVNLPVGGSLLLAARAR